MTNTSRAAAVVAAAALSMSGATGVAHAQSGTLNFDVLQGLQSSDVNFPDMASTDLGSVDLIPGSANVIPDGSSQGIGEGSTNLGGSADVSGSAGTIANGISGSLTGGSLDPVITGVSGSIETITGSVDNSGGSTGAFTDALAGSIETGGSAGDITSALGGSLEDIGGGITGSLGDGGSAGDITSALGGSIEDGGSLTGILGGVERAIDATSGSVTDPDTGVLGSLTGNGGSTGQSSDAITGTAFQAGQLILGSAEDLTAVNGSLTAFTGSLENGSLSGTASVQNGSSQAMGSTNAGSNAAQTASVETLSADAGGSGSLLPLLSVGGAAALGGAAVGAAAGATVQLPPLPGIPGAPTVCDLPQAQVDQLAGLGSVDAQNCPDPRN